jgi:ubiquinone/menaquinone biosynthesis C-methylase UbiE
MSKYPYEARAYDERYRRVYEAGAEYWEEPIPTEVLIKFLFENKLRKGSVVVEFGCGEGRNSVFLARSGFKVVSIDTSRSGLTRAKQLSKRGKVEVDLLIADVVNLPVRDEIFDFEVSVSCLSLMTIQDARDRHLRESYRVLKTGCTYFSCNSVVDQSVSVEEFYKNLGKQPGTLTPRKVTVHGKEQEILLPIIASWPKTMRQYSEEFEKAGFTIVEINRVDVKLEGERCVLVARKAREI